MKQKKNILFLCGWYPSRVLPNNGDFIQRHAKAVSMLNNVTVLHIITDEKCLKNIEIVSTEINGITTHIAYLKKTWNPFKKIILFLLAFKKLLKKIPSFDLVHLHEVYPFGIFSVYLKWFYKKQYIISEHWTDYKYPLSKKISFLQKIISKIIVKNASFVCPVTEDLKNSMQIFGLKGTYEVVENVVNTNKFFPKKTEKEQFSIVHISNMNDPHKNISGILNTVAKIKDKIANYNIKIIGKNSLKYKEYANELNINSSNIQFIDHISHKEVVTHLQDASLFILFSNFENLPCVILESFACGTPVISTSVGGISECFPANFGRLIPIKDKEKLLEEILHFYHKKHKIATKDEMYTYVEENFSEKIICHKFTNLYSKSIIN